jgi:hypothetical protein
VKPQRIQLRRSRGWRMPPHTVKVDRATRFGNPFIVGVDGSQIMCVYWFILLVCGYLCVSQTRICLDRQNAATEALKAERAAGFPTLRGKDLACWCKPGTPCHADVLLAMVNKPRRRRGFDLDGFLARYGWRVVNGRAERISKAAP